MTERQKKKAERNKDICKMYDAFVEQYGEMAKKHALVSKIAEAFDVCVSTIYKVIEARDRQ